MSGVAHTNNASLAAWREKIESAWQKSVQSVIEVGRLVKQAKEELGVSFSLLEAELPFSSTVAAFLIKISEHPVLSNPAYFSKLPNGYNTLYYLASVDEKELVEQIENGEITPNFTLARAKALRDVTPKKSASKKLVPKKKSKPVYEVGTISISAPNNTEQFQQELTELLEKYGGSITYTHKENSLADWHRQLIHQQACEMIRKSEKSLHNISYEQVRMLEDAAHYLSKNATKKAKAELVIKGELVIRDCLPDDYRDLKKIRALIGIQHVTRGQLKKWCIENKVPNQFTEVSKMDKDLYIWEQVRLIAERKDVRGATKRLNDLATRSTIIKIKNLAQKALNEVSRFENTGA